MWTVFFAEFPSPFYLSEDIATGDTVQLSPPHTHSHPGELTVQQLSLTLSTVAACVALRAGAWVLCAAASIHTPDITGLNCRGGEREQTVDGVGWNTSMNRYTSKNDKAFMSPVLSKAATLSQNKWQRERWTCAWVNYYFIQKLLLVSSTIPGLEEMSINQPSS